MTPSLKRRDVLAGAGALALAGAKGALAQTPPALPMVMLSTTDGDIVIALETTKAPLTAANFLKYVDNKRYDNGTFYRAMRGDPATPGDWGLIQGGSDPKKPRYPGVAHEPTSQTGLSNKPGAITMARGAPGSATSDFFICVGDMSGLDADPKAQGDNLGYAVFGHVMLGMDVVKKIQGETTKADAEVEAMKGQMLATPIKIATAKRLPPAP